jgi:PEP-CTERM motif
MAAMGPTLGKFLGTVTLALALISTTASGALATTEILFTLTGSDPTVAFELPQNPTPDTNNLPLGFIFNSVSGTIGGSAATFSPVTFLFPPSSGGEDLAIGYNSDCCALLGPQLYSVSGGVITFVTGVYTVSNTGASSYNTLTISDIPEPSTWAMLIAGFGFLGWRYGARRGGLKIIFRAA